MKKFLMNTIILLALFTQACRMDPELTSTSIPEILQDDQPPYIETVTPVPTPAPTPFPASMLLHFENEVVAFDYLKGMSLYSNNDPAFVTYPDIDLGGEMVAGLGDEKFYDFNTYHRSIKITQRPIPQGSNLEEIFRDTYAQAEAKYPQETGILDADGLVKINGWDGLQKTYRVYSGEPAYELRDIWFQKGDELIILSIWTIYTNPDDFAVFQSGADALLESLVFSQPTIEAPTLTSLPPETATIEANSQAACPENIGKIVFSYDPKDLETLCISGYTS